MLQSRSRQHKLSISIILVRTAIRKTTLWNDKNSRFVFFIKYIIDKKPLIAIVAYSAK